MTIPDQLLIRHEPDFRTSTIGWYDHGQFFGHVTSPGFEPGYRFNRDDWHLHKLWYAVLYLFDEDGDLVELKTWCPGAAKSGQEEVLADWLGDLPGLVYGDIAVRLFRREVDGFVFGLIPECHGEYPPGEEELDWVEMYPGSLGFAPPWDGLYST